MPQGSSCLNFLDRDPCGPDRGVFLAWPDLCYHEVRARKDREQAKRRGTVLTMGDEERFERWEPIDGLAPKMFLDAMYDDREGFRLILKSPEPKTRALRILFDAPLCYRGAQEAYLLRQIYEAHEIYPWPIFIVRNSRYARWFYAQAAGAIDRDGHHYHIAAMDEMIDVLSARPPIVSWLNDV